MACCVHTLCTVCVPLPLCTCAGYHDALAADCRFQVQVDRCWVSFSFPTLVRSPLPQVDLLACLIPCTPDRCRFCDHRAITSTGRANHELLHTGERPFSCSYCAYRSKQKGTLREHEERHRARGDEVRAGQAGAVAGDDCADDTAQAACERDDSEDGENAAPDTAGGGGLGNSCAGAAVGSPSSELAALSSARAAHELRIKVGTVQRCHRDGAVKLNAASRRRPHDGSDIANGSGTGALGCGKKRQRKAD
jgi:hypothetical protein